MSRPVDVGDLKEGQYVIIDEEPCHIVEITKSKPGKHGSAKARVVGLGVFDGVKRSFVKPVDAKVDVPIIEKRSGQVIAVLSNSVQLMDLETYEVFETPIPQEEDIRSKIANGVEVEYWQIMGRKKIMRVKGS
ncbi:MAG: translation initiation factor IF-5A [Candidatus Bathyarchaeia archaeon]